MSGGSRPAFKVRRAVPADAPAMVRAHARSWRATYAGVLPDAVIADVVKSRPARIVRWQARLAEPKHRSGSFVGELDGQVVGFVFWGPTVGPDSTTDTAEVQAIYLDPDAIGRGIGRALLDAAVGDMVADGFAAAILWVLDTNDRARRFYEVAGWWPDGGTKSEDRPSGTLQEVRYRRSLGPDAAPSRGQSGRLA
jgi:GNAT superfamily N-acetyltransferase